MKKIYAFAAIIPILILSCVLYGCSDTDDDDDYAMDESYYYPEIQNRLFLRTSSVSLEITSDVSQPSFAWRATGSKYFVITIFKSKIDLKDNRIANPEDAVWTWNTGLGKGREGNISYSDGRDVRNEEIQYTVTRLPYGTYYIAAWGYDDEYNLLYSSKEYLYEYYR